MSTLLEILELMEIEDTIIRKDAEMMARDKVSKLIMPWSEEFPISTIKSRYRTYASMDYENMRELPENMHFIFDPSGKFFECYFGIDYLERKVEIPHQPNEELVSIILGKSPIENSAYIVIASGAARIAGRIKAVKDNEQISEPILYASIRGHIEILLPKNLVYSR